MAGSTTNSRTGGGGFGRPADLAFAYPGSVGGGFLAAVRAFVCPMILAGCILASAGNVGGGNLKGVFYLSATGPSAVGQAACMVARSRQLNTSSRMSTPPDALIAGHPHQQLLRPPLVLAHCLSHGRSDALGHSRYGTYCSFGEHQLVAEYLN